MKKRMATRVIPTKKVGPPVGGPTEIGLDQRADG
jgi:hypothetical protein